MAVPRLLRPSFLPRPRRRTGLALAAVVAISLGALASAPPASAGQTPGLAYFVESDPGQVGGTYTPVVGNFSNAQYYDDILWYSPGAGVEQFWTNAGNKVFTKKALGNVVTNSYTPIVGDFAGDSLDDILWYAPGAAADVLWVSSGAAVFTPMAVSITGNYKPIVLRDTTTKDDILWLNQAGTTSAVWSFGIGGHSNHQVTAPPGTQALPGDFDADGSVDVFWYGPGAVADARWSGNGSGVFVTKAEQVGGTYQPYVAQLTPYGIGHGEVEQDRTDDIMWFKPTGAVSTWSGNTNRTWTNGTAGTFGMDGKVLPGRGQGNAFVWSPTLPDKYWYAPSLIDYTGNTEPGVGYTPIVGNWFGTPTTFFYKPGPAPEVLFT